MDEVDIYDLGNAGGTRPRLVLTPRFKRAHPRPAPNRPRSALPATAGSLSLFLPGSGQLLLGEIRLGVFFLSLVAFLVALTWAVVAGLDRLVPTLDLLGVPRQAVVAALAIAFLAGAALHLAGVVDAHQRACVAADATSAPPILAGLASLLVPGWGQLLRGRRRRSALFLGGAWTLGAAWIVVSPLGQRVLSSADVALPASLRDGWGPVALVTLSAVLWVVAVYDALTGVARR